jgi:thioredoxin reductase
MSKILILGAGIAGHTAASYLQKGLTKISPNFWI